MPFTFKVDNAKDIWNDRIPFSLVFPDASVPEECKSGKDIVFHILYENGQHVNAGEPIVEVIFFRTDDRNNGHHYEDKIGSFFINADTSGYILHQFANLDHTIDDLERPIIFFSTLEEFIRTSYPINYNIKKDEFTSEKSLTWIWGESDDAESRLTGYLLNIGLKLKYDVEKNLPVIRINFLKKRLRINKKDTIHFKFEDGSILSFPVITLPVNDSPKSLFATVSLGLSFSDIEKFSNVSWLTMRVEHFNNERPLDFDNSRNQDKSEEFSRAIFKYYTKCFTQALNELGISPKVYSGNYSRVNDDPKFPDNSCYVYLMIDTSNGYHKIGISNHPDYREKTLQSEKPTIEKICAKKYPSRLIAQSIESALHTAFSAKRIRGEWFDLSETEVAQIIATLS